MNTTEQFRRARRAGVPLVAIGTADPMATIQEVAKVVNGNAPVVAWDCIRGVWGVNDLGMQYANDGVAGNPAGMLMAVAPELPDDSVVFLLAMDDWLGEAPVRQGIWNLRNPYKASGRMAVLLGSAFTLPPSLANDIVVIDQELPTEAELMAIVNGIDEAASESVTDRPAAGTDAKTRIVDSIRGLSAYAAEQIVAMNATKEGFDQDGVWEAKRKQVEQTGGISIHRGSEGFSQIGGLANLKEFAQRILDGKEPPKGIVFLDEIEKLMAGSSTSGGDSSGVSQGMLQALLTYMQDHEVTGMILIGPPGTGKSMIAKAMGNEARVPTICLDTNAMKGSLVGQSEQAMRSALKVITSVTSDKSLWVATCNSISSLPPELRRRFTLGTFFVDLPDEEEREQIWKGYMAKYEITPKDKRPNDQGWTGAEIKNCCHLAWMLQIPMVEAASYIVPVSISAKDVIDRLRKECDGRYLSASCKGLFRATADVKTPKRKLSVK